MVGHPPALTSQQVQELQQRTNNRTVRVELNTPTPRSVELQRAEFLPETISGSSADGYQTIPVRDTSAVVWREPAVGTGMLFGFLGGLLVGALAGAASSCQSDTGVCAYTPLAGGALGGLAGLLLGGIFGAVWGSEERLDIERSPSR